MNKLFPVVLISLFALASCKQEIKVQYPVTQKVDQVDDYFGTSIADPYRWLENDTSAETAEWVKAQNQVTNDYLSQIPFRPKIKERLTKIWDYPRYGLPFREGKNYFFFKNTGMQNQAVLYVREGLEGEPRVLLDPNTLSEDGTVALADLAVSKDGKYLAYATASGGSDWNEIQVMEIETGKKYDDLLKWVKFSGISWQGDGFYYSRYDEPKKGSKLSGKNEYHKVYFHKIGTSQSADLLVYENRQYPLRNYGLGVSEDEKYLFLSESESTSGNALYFREADKKNAPFKLIAPGFENDYSVVDNIPAGFLMVTNFNAPKKKLVLVDPANPDAQNWKDILPEQADVLETVTIAGGKIIAEYQKDASSRAYIYDFDGKPDHELTLPGIGSLSGFSCKQEDTLAFYSFTSFIYPNTIFKYDIAKNASEIYFTPEIEFQPDQYEVKQVFYNSKDGTKIPMFIVHKKDIKMNGKNPTLLYGYGGFNVSLTPSFSTSRIVFLENGGVYALANIRGGGEYGEDWHKAGIKEKKQNVFDDFIAAAEFLIGEKYTTSEKLAMMGGSNGGLLVGAVMTQRPELFKVAIPQVGVMDMLRYHKFTIGWAWATDYGTSEDSAGFNYLIKYSPLHTLKEGTCYPATIAFTADHDDRVVPAHTFKFMATLQEKQKCGNPVLVRIETKAGHGAGTPTAKLIDEATDLWSFVFYNLDMKMK
ncbi:MAG: S9 family peptidase [Bacteroidetes bacterium]|nr:S9 family peptidase [Bacteroidota bacterium]